MTDEAGFAFVTDCVFCRIVDQSMTSFEVLRSEHAVAFLDIRPVFPGHTLVVPPVHVDTFPDLPADALAGYFAEVQRLSLAVPAAMRAQGTFVAMNNVVSQSVPHLHTHVVPRTKGDGLRGFFWPRRKYGEGEAVQTAAAIREALELLGRAVDQG
jgi:histidine triad (HIT) family protein